MTSINRTPSSPRPVAPQQVQQAQAPARTQAPAAPARAAASTTAQADGFRNTISNAFNAARTVATQVQSAASRLSENPIAQQAMGQYNPTNLINQARDYARGQLNERTSGWTGQGPSGSISGQRGTLTQGNVGSIIDSARSGGTPAGGLGIPQTRQTSGSREVSQGTQQTINNAAGRFNQIAQGAQQLTGLAERAGIALPSADRSGSVSAERTLYQSGNTSVTANASASGSAHAGLDGLRAQGQAQVGVSAQTGASTSTTGRYGSASADVTARAQVGASATGSASLDASGLNATGRVQVGATVSADANARVESRPVTIAGVPLTANASVHGHVEAGASASAEGTARVTAGPPPAAVVRGTAGAYAGARASAEATAGFGPFSVTGHGEGWAGAGAEASAHAGYENGRISFGANAGAALGLGGSAGFNVSVDVNQIRQMAGNTIDSAAHAARDLVRDPIGTLNRAERTVNTAVNTVQNAASTAVNTVQNAASTAASRVTSAASSAASTVANAASNAASNVRSAASRVLSWRPW